MENKKQLCCFKFYDRKGRRVSAFSEVYGCQLVITTFYCGLDDIHKFSKKFSWNIWKEHNGKTVEQIKKDFGVTLHQTTIEIDPEHPRKEFLDYLRRAYYQYHDIPVLIKQLVPGIEVEYYKIISKGHKTK